MRPEPEQIQEAIVAIAHGEEHALADWVRSQPELHEDLKLWEKIAAAAEGRSYSASGAAVSAAKSILPERRVLPVLVRLGLVGARREGGAIPATVSVGGLEFHVMYAPVPTGWRVLGEAEGADFEILTETEVETPEKGRFQFEVERLEDTEFSVRTEEGVWVVSAPTPTN